MNSKKGLTMKTALALLLLCLPRLALAAGSVSFSTQQINQGGTAYMVTINWTGDASTGSVPTTTITGLNQVQGYTITQIQTVPGTPAPTAGYSITVKDVNGYDMAGGQASSLSATAAASFATTSATPPIVGSLSFALTGNSVASAKGKVILYIYKPSVLAAANLLGRYGSGNSSGDVVGPASSTDNALARFDGTTGKLIQDSSVTVDDSGNLATPGSVAAGSSPPTCTAGTAGVWCGKEGTAPIGEASTGMLYWKTDHLLYANPNNAGEVQVPTASSTATLTNKTFDTAGTGNSFKINGTAITAVSGTGAVCLASGSACSGGSSVSSTPPYLTISSTKYIANGMYTVTTPPSSSWTALNSQTSSTGSQGEITITSVGTTNGNFYGFYRTITSNTLEAAISCAPGYGASGIRAGVGVRGSGGDMYIVGPSFTPSQGFGFAKWTNETTYSGGYETGLVGQVMYVKVVNNGSTVTPYGSTDGKTWFQVYDGGGGSNNVTGTGWAWGIQGSGNGVLNSNCTLLSWKEY